MIKLFLNKFIKVLGKTVRTNALHLEKVEGHGKRMPCFWFETQSLTCLIPQLMQERKNLVIADWDTAMPLPLW